MNSLWIETTKNQLKLEPLEKDEETEVCVIGRGLFGLTTAYYLTCAGKKVTVIENQESEAVLENIKLVEVPDLGQRVKGILTMIGGIAVIIGGIIIGITVRKCNKN